MCRYMYMFIDICVDICICLYMYESMCWCAYVAICAYVLEVAFIYRMHITISLNAAFQRVYKHMKFAQICVTTHANYILSEFSYKHFWMFSYILFACYILHSRCSALHLVAANLFLHAASIAASNSSRLIIRDRIPQKVTA